MLDNGNQIKTNFDVIDIHLVLPHLLLENQNMQHFEILEKFRY